jgi:hypothetical protein
VDEPCKRAGLPGKNAWAGRAYLPQTGVDQLLLWLENMGLLPQA